MTPTDGLPPVDEVRPQYRVVYPSRARGGLRLLLVAAVLVAAGSVGLIAVALMAS